MSLDFNSAERNDQRSTGSYEPIPKGEIVKVIFGAQKGKDFLTYYPASGVKMITAVMTVTEGEHAKRMVFTNMGISGKDTEGHKKMVDITKSTIRAILESARGVRPDDESPEAMKARSIEDWEDLIGMEYLARVDIKEEMYNGEKQQKNVLYPITPNEEDYAKSGFKPVKPRAAAPPREMATTDENW